jgi:hypothetical protein
LVCEVVVLRVEFGAREVVRILGGFEEQQAGEDELIAVVGRSVGRGGGGHRSLIERLGGLLGKVIERASVGQEGLGVDLVVELRCIEDGRCGECGCCARRNIGTRFVGRNEVGRSRLEDALIAAPIAVRGVTLASRQAKGTNAPVVAVGIANLDKEVIGRDMGLDEPVEAPVRIRRATMV